MVPYDQSWGHAGAITALFVIAGTITGLKPNSFLTPQSFRTHIMALTPEEWADDYVD